MTQERKFAAILSLAIGVLMLLGKWIAYLLTGSHAILSDALESIVHVVATAFALISIILNSRPPDQRYPYGYGKITYFSAGFEGGLIALAALAIFYEAAQGLILGQELKRLDLGFLIIGVASFINLALGIYLIRAGKRLGSLVLAADGHHVLADSYTSFGVVAGVALVWLTKLDWLDGVVALAVGLNILATGYRLVQEGFSGLMDRSDPELLESIVRTLHDGREEGWVDVHQLRAWRSGDRCFVDFHLVVPEDWNARRLHDTNDRCKELLQATLGDATELIIHFDPDQPGTFDPSVAWTVASATRVPFGEHAEPNLGEAVASVNEIPA
jgi:cation diffusion facilitator family transporter